MRRSGRACSQGVTILRDRRRYFREVWLVQFGGWLFRFTAFWFLLEAFHVGGSVRNVLLVLGVNAVAALVPFTPGGAGVQQALLVKVFAGTAAGATVAAYSVGQQIAIAAFSLAVGFVALVLHLPLPLASRRSSGRGRERARGGAIRRGRRELSGAWATAGPGAPRARGSRPRGRRSPSPSGSARPASRRCPARLTRLIAATVMSTASLIALSAQAKRCWPCICSANSAIRRCSSSGSPNRPPKPPSMTAS